MNNLKPSRLGFRFEHVLSTEGAKRKVILFEIMYLKSARAKGVRASLRPTEIEQGDGYTSESTLLYNEANVSAWLRLLPRKNDKAVLQVAEKIDAAVPEIIAAYQESPAAGRAALMRYSEEAV